MAAPTGSIANTATLLQLAADAKVRGLSLANPALAQAIGREASFAMRGASTIKGLVDFQTLEIKSQTLSAGFKGRASAAELKGRLDVAGARSCALRARSRVSAAKARRRSKPTSKARRAIPPLTNLIS